MAVMLPSESVCSPLSASRYSSRCMAIALAFETLSQPSRLCSSLLIFPDMIASDLNSPTGRGGIQGFEPGFPW